MKAHKEKKWEWSPVEGSLQNKQNQCIFPNLTPQTTNEMQLITSGKIELRKMFNFNPEQGWQWHWSCNLPQMEYSIVSLHQNSLADQSLQVELFITTKLTQANIFVDEGVIGVSKQFLKGNSVNFKGLKFKPSSDEIQEKLFQLLFLLYQTNEDGSVIIIDSHISPTIFVSSDNQTMVNVKTQNLHFLIDPFLPIFIDKELVKRERKNNQYTIQKIENSLSGFNNYFTSSNIRYKIIHPLFLFFKFSNFVRLYVTFELSEKIIEDIVEGIQINIFQLMAGEKVRKFVILFLNLEGNNETKKKVPISKILNKAIKIIQKLENNYYEIYTQESYLPKDITEIKDIQTLIRCYKQQHDTLGELKLQKNQQNQLSKPQKKQQKMDIIVSSLTCDQNFEKSEEIHSHKQEQPIKLENYQQPDQQKKPIQQNQECTPQSFQNYCNQYNQEQNQRYYYGNQMNQNLQQQQYQYYMNQSNQFPYGWPSNYPFL